MSIRREFEARDAKRNLDKHSGWDLRHIVALDSVLTEVFVETQEAVHVITGALKASGRIRSSNDEDTWEGHITYGGVSSPTSGSGHHPAGSVFVDYAEYEQERAECHIATTQNQPGQHHDFLYPARFMDGLYEAAIRDFLED